MYAKLLLIACPLIMAQSPNAAITCESTKCDPHDCHLSNKGNMSKPACACVGKEKTNPLFCFADGPACDYGVNEVVKPCRLETSHGDNKNAIIGGVIGAVAVLGLVALWLRRRRQARQQQPLRVVELTHVPPPPADNMPEPQKPQQPAQYGEFGGRTATPQGSTTRVLLHFV